MCKAVGVTLPNTILCTRQIVTQWWSKNNNKAADLVRKHQPIYIPNNYKLSPTHNKVKYIHTYIHTGDLEVASSAASFAIPFLPRHRSPRAKKQSYLTWPDLTAEEGEYSQVQWYHTSRIYKYIHTYILEMCPSSAMSFASSSALSSFLSSSPWSWSWSWSWWYLFLSLVLALIPAGFLIVRTLVGNCWA